MSSGPRGILSSLYPLHWLNRRRIRFRDRCRYFWLARRNGIELYPETPSNALLNDIKAIDLLHRLRVNHEWIPESLLPSGGAADHKFLYILGRALAQFRFRNILELGAGETTKLLSAYARHTGARVVTLEHDAAWIERAREGLGSTHTMIHCPLVESTDVSVGRYLWYDVDAAAVAGENSFDLLIIDGPAGVARWSRVGFVKAFPTLRASDWLVLWDDIERIGDFESFALLVRELRNDDGSFGQRLFVSQRTLGALFTPRFDSVRYFF